ncbi:hypothetical protein NW755_009420 [Fusarium falciforme]|uniref:Uncharacterized protein n=1 Tax=Fusarium falciforme TaxID=195108 RepID=A0A9W8UZE5_9HYPO|nr:hypothetical protein NW755_009420 [Fusarium falciforme]
MKDIYGSPFAYSSIVKGGTDKLVDALRPGGMQNRKAKILMTLLEDVKAKYGKWDLQHLFTKTDDEVNTEVTKFWGIGPNSSGREDTEGDQVSAALSHDSAWECMPKVSWKWKSARALRI